MDFSNYKNNDFDTNSSKNEKSNKVENKQKEINNVAYQSYIDMRKKELDKILEEQEKEIALMKDIIQKQKSLLKKYDNIFKKYGIDSQFSEDRAYMIALKNILKDIKKIVEAGNDVPDVYFNEVEADITSLYLWKEATREEVLKVIESYGIYDIIANNISKRLLTDDNIY